MNDEKSAGTSPRTVLSAVFLGIPPDKGSRASVVVKAKKKEFGTVFYLGVLGGEWSSLN
jgi:hypothetical protein